MLIVVPEDAPVVEPAVDFAVQAPGIVLIALDEDSEDVALVEVVEAAVAVAPAAPVVFVDSPAVTANFAPAFAPFVAPIALEAS